MDSIPLMKGSCSQISNISLAIICCHLNPIFSPSPLPAAGKVSWEFYLYEDLGSESIRKNNIYCGILLKLFHPFWVWPCFVS